MIELKKNNQKGIIEENDPNTITAVIPIEHIKVKNIKLSLKGKSKTEKEQINDLYEELKNVKDNMKGDDIYE